VIDDPNPVVLARDVRAQQASSRSLERAARDGTRIRPRRGAYVDAETWRAASPETRHRFAIDATLGQARSSPVLAFESAAVALGIPLVGDPPARVHTIVRPGSAKSNRAVTRTHRELDPRDVVTLDNGWRATAPAVTALDLAMSRSPLAGILAVSHVRRAFGLSAEALLGMLRARTSVRGVARARLAIGRSVPEATSALEVLVDVRCADLGFERPRHQVPVRGVDGRDYVCDFAWLGGRVLGESDGEHKYRDAELRGEASAADVVVAEKRREDALRPMCDRFVRLSWRDVWHGEGLERRLSFAGVPRPGRPARLLTF